MKSRNIIYNQALTVSYLIKNIYKNKVSYITTLWFQYTQLNKKDKKNYYYILRFK